MTQTDFLDALRERTQTLLIALREPSEWNQDDKLQSRPAEKAWTGLESLAHANLFFDIYLPQIERAFHKSAARKWAQGETPKHSSTGKRLISKCSNTDKKFRTKKRYNTLGQEIKPSEIKRLIINLERTLRILDAAEKANLNKPQIKKHKSLFGSFYPGELLEYLLAHTERHLQQAIAATSQNS